MLGQVESGQRVKEVCREHGISEGTYHRWKWSCPGTVDGLGLSGQAYLHPRLVAVAGGLWETRSVFQRVWEGAGRGEGAAAFHALADLRPG